jgi:hypothetical protein
MYEASSKLSVAFGGSYTYWNATSVAAPWLAGTVKGTTTTASPFTGSAVNRSGTERSTSLPFVASINTPWIE